MAATLLRVLLGAGLGGFGLNNQAPIPPAAGTTMMPPRGLTVLTIQVGIAIGAV